MRKSKIASYSAWIAGAVIVATWGSLEAAYKTIGQPLTLSAVAVVGLAGSGGSASGALTLNVPRLLPFMAFFGKDVVIPVEIVGPAGTSNQGTFVTASPASTLGAFLGGASVSQSTSTTSQGTASEANLAISLVYQLFNLDGIHSLSGPVNVPIAFRPEPGNPNSLSGTIIIPAQTMQPVGHGGLLKYYFQVVRGTQQTQFKLSGAQGPDSFKMQFTNTLSFPVSDLGSVVVVPDPFLTDGKTTISFALGALSNPGTLLVRQDDITSVPAGPGGLAPIVVYDFELQGTRLEREAQIMLSYAAHPDGSIVGSNGNPQDLAPYWLQAGSNWLVLGPRQFDSTMHTVAVTSPHFSTFALFLSGATGAADLRPRQRILTPNGDGSNDTVDFSGIVASDGVHLFDLKGRRVRTLQSPNLIWDGRDDGGNIVESGLYIYQYTSQGDRVSGVILVAK